MKEAFDGGEKTQFCKNLDRIFVLSSPHSGDISYYSNIICRSCSDKNITLLKNVDNAGRVLTETQDCLSKEGAKTATKRGLKCKYVNVNTEIKGPPTLRLHSSGTAQRVPKVNYKYKNIKTEILCNLSNLKIIQSLTQAFQSLFSIRSLYFLFKKLQRVIGSTFLKCGFFRNKQLTTTGKLSKTVSKGSLSKPSPKLIVT